MQKRRLYAALASGALATGVVAATAASASAGTNVKFPPGTQIDVATAPTGCPQLGNDDVVITVQSGHMNNIDGTHTNATIEGGLSLVNTGGTGILPGVVDASGGHGMAWFTFNSNGATVQTDVVNGKIGTLNIHLAGTFVVNANGDIKVNNLTASCH